ncbi:MAG: hypothetical protein ACLU3I_18240 [Acutalibacteraceae bacterium]
MEMAYFMDMHGAFDVVSYHEQLSSEQLRLNEDNLARYCAFQESGTDVQCTASEPYLYIIFTVYDRWADPFGTVIFVVNQSAVTSIMGKLSDYQDAFWYLFDKDGAVVLSESALRLSAEEQRELADAGHDACYTRKLDGSRYLLFSEASGIGAALCCRRSVGADPAASISGRRAVCDRLRSAFACRRSGHVLRCDAAAAAASGR